jgi:hypothetical protein
MLYKNDEPQKLNQKEIEAIEKFFHGKFPVKVVYPTQRIVKSKLAHNRKPDKPNSISFDFKSIVKTPEGTEVWRYAENVVTDAKGNKHYSPKKFIFKGSTYLKRNDIEKIYFLLRKSEYRVISEEELKANPKLVQTSIPKFVFEDLISVAEKKAEKKEIENKVSNLIYSKELCLQEDKLRAVTVAFCGLSQADDYSLAQIKAQLYDKVMATPEGPDKFFNMIDADQEIAARLAIQSVIDSGLLKPDQTKKGWYWQGAGDKGNTKLCGIPINKSPIDALYDEYMGNQEFRDDLQAMKLTKNRNAGKTKKEEGPAE